VRLDVWPARAGQHLVRAWMAEPMIKRRSRMAPAVGSRQERRWSPRVPRKTSALGARSKKPNVMGALTVTQSAHPLTRRVRIGKRATVTPVDATQTPPSVRASGGRSGPLLIHRQSALRDRCATFEANAPLRSKVGCCTRGTVRPGLGSPERPSQFCLRDTRRRPIRARDCGPAQM